MSSYGEIYQKWRTAAGPDWPAYVDHKFVRGLQDGTLPKDAFLHYLTQDYVFLIHFSRAWALAITKAETLEEMRLCAGTVNVLINEEIALHVKTCAAAGISEDQLFNAVERTENLAYTRYVLDAGHSGDFLDLMAALAPCVIGYGEIGARISADYAPEYAEWVETYSSDDFQEACKAVGQLIDGAVARRLGDNPEQSPRWARLCERFNMATKLEIGFWDMGLTP